MPRVPITDLDDPRLAPYCHLKATNATRHDGLFVVEGETMVDRLLASRYPVDSVLATDQYEARIAAKVPGDVPLLVIPRDRVESLVGFHFHRGVLGCGRIRPWPPLDAILGGSGPRATLVVCPKLDKPDNLGSILRTADAFGVIAVLLGSSCPDPLSRRVIRVSMGSALKLPIYVPDDLIGAVDRLHADHGIRRFAAVARPGAEPFDREARPDRLALILGSEAHGLDEAWLARVDRAVTIPIRPDADSLNVGVAAAILLQHFTREEPRRGRSDPDGLLRSEPNSA